MYNRNIRHHFILMYIILYTTKTPAKLIGAFVGVMGLFKGGIFVEGRIECIIVFGIKFIGSNP